MKNHLEKIGEQIFLDWWSRDGHFIDPDPDVDWYDKRHLLAEEAFRAALAISRNYVANVEVNPNHVRFVNGRIVAINSEGGLVVTTDDASGEQFPATNSPGQPKP